MKKEDTTNTIDTNNRKNNKTTTIENISNRKIIITKSNIQITTNIPNTKNRQHNKNNTIETNNNILNTSPNISTGNTRSET